MASLNISSKKLQISKANATMVVVLAVASFITVASLVASRTLLIERSYQAKVVTQKEKARNQLRSNLKAVDSLVVSYQQFVGTTDNIIGGGTVGQTERDGDNAKIILDALPSKYDFPALTASLEKILTDRNITIDGITGTDDEVAQDKTNSSDVSTPVDMPFEVQVSGNYGAMQDLVSVFERSIRPIQVQKLSLSGSDSSMKLDLTAKTYYQPEKGLDITTEAVN